MGGTCSADGKDGSVVPVLNFSWKAQRQDTFWYVRLHEGMVRKCIKRNGLWECGQDLCGSEQGPVMSSVGRNLWVPSLSCSGHLIFLFHNRNNIC